MNRKNAIFKANEGGGGVATTVVLQNMRMWLLSGACLLVFACFVADDDAALKWSSVCVCVCF